MSKTGDDTRFWRNEKFGLLYAITYDNLVQSRSTATKTN